jgi:hypothetical protein
VIFLKEITFVEGYPLRLKWESIEKMVEALGIQSFSEFDRVINIRNIGPVQFRIILWAGLLYKYPEIKQEEVSDIIDKYRDSHGVTELYTLVGKLLIEAGLITPIEKIKRGNDTGEEKTEPLQSS